MAPCTTTIRPLPSQVVLEPEEDPIHRRSAVSLDSVQTVPIAMLTERVGQLGTLRMIEVCAALEVAVGCAR